MSSGSKRVILIDYLSNTNRRYLLHHLLVHLRTNVSLIDRIFRVSELNLHIFKAVWHKGAVRLLHVLGVV